MPIRQASFWSWSWRLDFNKQHAEAKAAENVDNRSGDNADVDLEERFGALLSGRVVAAALMDDDIED